MRLRLSIGRMLLLAPALWSCSGDIGDGQGQSGPPPPDYLPADGVTIQRIAIYQGVERVLMDHGAPTTGGATGVPVVAGRDALVRVFYSTSASYDGGPVIGRLSIGQGAPIEIAAPLVAASDDKLLGSTLDFAVPGASITASATFRVDVLRAAAQTSGQNAGAGYPQNGQQSFAAVSTGAKLHVVLVPIRYQADGSGRLPDTSAAQLAVYRDVLYKLYPVPDVDIRIAPVFDWNQPVTGGGQGWAELLAAISDLRTSAKAAPTEYYYGLFRAADTFGQFCGSGCLAGLSHIPNSPFDAGQRAGVGIGFSGEDVAMVAAHELGHEHGRFHAPCGTSQGLDPAYPYQGGVTGSWGYDLLAKQLEPPTQDDVMSYCQSRWISDYNFGALITWMQGVDSSMDVAARGGQLAPQRYERLSLQPAATGATLDRGELRAARIELKWFAPIELQATPLGAPEPIHVETDQGPLELMGYFYPYSDLPGGIVLFSEPAAAPRSVMVRGLSRAR